ncbi:MAG: ankyrin repeat domain-containing protein [Lachnospiraceae bacterium]|nr:ankyrin repeat domain-containing protein [Lachnospiraceae bacterium]
MPKLRKTLPENFQELINAGDDEAVKAALQKCEVGAYRRGYSKDTALFYTGLSRELIGWLLERGEKINHRNQYKRTPLHAQAESANGAVALYLELGAELDAVDSSNETPLFRAVAYYQTENVKILLEHGANIHKRNMLFNRNPLEEMLSGCMNAYIEKAAQISELFLGAGMQVSDNMKKSVVRIGNDYEFYKEQFPPEFAEQAKRGVARLYELFDVPPVPPIEKHDEKSQITVSEDKWWKCHDELWKKLVPPSGHANTVQGEVIRCSGKLAHELMDNGAMNWDSDYRTMLKKMPEYFKMGNPLEQTMQQETKAIVAKILKMKYPEMIDKEPERIMEFAVAYVRQNPNPIELKQTDYSR